MGNKLYVGNLPYRCSDEELAGFFGTEGNVTSARVVVDRDTGRSKGFGFIEMTTDDEAQQAIANLNGKPFQGRNVTVNEARPREEGGQRSNNRGQHEHNDREYAGRGYSGR